MDRTLYENIIYGFFNNEQIKGENIKHINKVMKQMNLDEHIVKIFNEKMDTPMGIDEYREDSGKWCGLYEPCCVIQSY